MFGVDMDVLLEKYASWSSLFLKTFIEGSTGTDVRNALKS